MAYNHSADLELVLMHEEISVHAVMCYTLLMGSACVRAHLAAVCRRLAFGLREEAIQREEGNSCLIIQDAEIKK